MHGPTRPNSVLLPIAAAILIAFSAGTSPAADTSPTSALARFSPEQRTDLSKGKAIYEYSVDKDNSESTSGHCTASILIHAPVEDCFRRFCDIESHRLYFPRKTVSRVVGTMDGKTLAYKELDFSLKTVKYYILYSIDPGAHRIDFELDKSHPSDLKESEGYFHFIPVDENTTLFDYGITNAELGVQIPGFIRKYMTSKDLPRVVTNYKNWVESGGTWKK